MSLFIQQFNCQPQFLYGNPPDSIPLWVAAREDNTLSSRLTRPSHFPSVSFYYFTYIVIWPGSYQDCQIKKCISNEMHFYLAASYPPRFTTDLAVFLMGNPKDFLSIMTYSPRKQYFVSAPSISACVLNFRVGMGATTTYCRSWLPFNWIEIRMDFLLKGSPVCSKAWP